MNYFLSLLISLYVGTSIASSIALAPCHEQDSCWQFQLEQKKCQISGKGLLSCWSQDDLNFDLLVPLGTSEHITSNQLLENNGHLFWQRQLGSDSNQLVAIDLTRKRILWIKNLQGEAGVLAISASGIQFGGQHYDSSGLAK